MLDSAGKRVAEQSQLQFLAERRQRLDISDGCRQRIPRARRSHRKCAIAERGSTCQRQDQCRRHSRLETATWSHISRPMKHLNGYAKCGLQCRSVGSGQTTKAYSNAKNETVLFITENHKRNVCWKTRVSKSCQSINCTGTNNQTKKPRQHTLLFNGEGAFNPQIAFSSPSYIILPNLVNANAEEGQKVYYWYVKDYVAHTIAI